MNNFKIAEISFFQLAIAIISLLFIFNKIRNFLKKEKSQTLLKLIFTLFIWGSIFVFSIFPNSTHILSEKLGLGENLNTLIFIGFLITYMVIFKIINIIERIERNISEIVRKEALSKLNNKKNDLF